MNFPSRLPILTSTPGSISRVLKAAANARRHMAGLLCFRTGPNGGCRKSGRIKPAAVSSHCPDTSRKSESALLKIQGSFELVTTLGYRASVVTPEVYSETHSEGRFRSSG